MTYSDPAHRGSRIEAMRNAGKDYEIHVFTGANHSLQIVDGGGSAPFEEPLAG